MTDYYAVLKRAVGGLEHESAEVRRAVYDKARTALISQLKSIQPPLTTSEISRQRLELEEAIRRVEREAAITAAGPSPARARAAAAAADDMAAQAVQTVEEESARAELEPAAAPQARVGGPRPPQPPLQRGNPRPVQPLRAPAPVASPVPEPLADTSPEPTIEPTLRQDSAPEVEPALAPPRPPRPGQWAPQVDPQDGPRRGKPPMARREPPLSPEPSAAPEPHVDRSAGDGPLYDAVEPQGDRIEGEAGTDLDAGRRGPPRRAKARPAAPAPEARRRDADDDEDEDEPRASRLPIVVLAVLAVLVLGGLAALGWSQRTAVEDVIGGLIASSGDNSSLPSADQATSPDAASGKNADRLGGAAPDEAPRSVRTVDAGPAPDGAEGDPLNGVVPPDDTAAAPPSIDDGKPAEPMADAQATPLPEAAQPTAPPAAQAPAADGTPAPTADAGQAAPAAGAPADQALVAQKAILYEQPTGSSGGQNVTALNATVVWKFVNDETSGPEIVADVDIPDRKMKATITIRKNMDTALPASHLVELSLDVPNDFPGGGIKSIPAFVMKPTEEARGQPLDGAAARVSDGFFWIAFAGDDAPKAQNIALMRERNWIDIPLVYNNDQRAILTLEKGTPGQQAFEQALAAWGN